MKKALFQWRLEASPQKAKYLVTGSISTWTIESQYSKCSPERLWSNLSNVQSAKSTSFSVFDPVYREWLQLETTQN